MKIDDCIWEAIESTDGHGIKIKLNGNEYLKKEEYIERVLKQGDTQNQSVLDIGCCGHKRNIDEQMSKGTWLHSKFDDLCKYNIGVDINKEACEYLKDHYNRKDVFCLNVLEEIDREKLSRLIPGGVFDYAILADVIEHTLDPIGFLKQIVDSKICKKVVISVPNAMHVTNTIFAVKESAETINSDHKFWFSPYTLIKCAYEAGIVADDIDVCEYSVKGKRIDRIIRRKIIGSTVVLTGHIK